MGMVFQAYNLFPHLTVLDNLHPGAAEGARRRRASAEATGAGAARRGSGWPTRPTSTPTGCPAASSNGWRWCARWPPSRALLLLDEVTAALDPELVGEVLEIVRRLAARRHDDGAGHPRDGVRPRRRHQVCFLHDGAILEQGPPAEIFEHPREERTREFLRRVLPRPSPASAGRVENQWLSGRLTPRPPLGQATAAV